MQLRWKGFGFPDEYNSEAQMQTWIQDLRYAVRQLRKAPGFTLTALLTLSLGIGINTAIFSSMDAVVLRPLAVPQMDRVVTVAEQQNRGGYAPVALANYEDWKRQSNSFEDLAVRTSADMSFSGGGEVLSAKAALISPNFFSVLKTPPLMGRVFQQTESQAGHDAVAVLSYSFWQTRFGGDVSILGRSVELSQRAYTIVGVMPKTMQYPSEMDLYLPLVSTPQQLEDRNTHSYLVLGRLRKGVTLQQSQAEMQTIATRLAAAYPASNRDWSVKVEPLLDKINGDLTPLYYRLVMGATYFVLLVVCANVANLQLARGIARRPEIAMRTALGATRWRVVRQLLLENVLLGVCGSAGGLGIAALYLRLSALVMPARVARYLSGWSNVSLNGRTLVYSFAVAAIAGCIAGLAPALMALRVDPMEQLKSGAKGSTGSGQSRMRNVFVVSQIAFAVALVIGAVLISKGMTAMLHSADSYHPEKILTFNVSLPKARYDTPQKRAAFYSESLAKLRALPGVSSAEVTTALPKSDWAWAQDFEIENRPAVPGKFQSAYRLPVSAGYFSALHIPIVSGRGILPGDQLNSLRVAVVSESFVSRYFPQENPLGPRIRLLRGEKDASWVTIVGVAKETSYTMWDQAVQPQLYLSVLQSPPEQISFAVTSKGDPLALAVPARKAVASVDSSLPLDLVESYRQFLHETLTGILYVAGMLAVDALIALFLASVGIFGVMATQVGERMREIGVRLALGARRIDIQKMILHKALRLTGIGIFAGVAMAYELAHLMANLFRGVRTDDPLVFSLITIVITAVSLASSWLPAFRATRVDPIVTLREE